MKTKALISFAVTGKLICAFVFAYADCWFSHEAAQIDWNDFFFKMKFLISIIFDHESGGGGIYEEGVKIQKRGVCLPNFTQNFSTFPMKMK